jgi:type III secretory pathway component EscT
MNDRTELLAAIAAAAAVFIVVAAPVAILAVSLSALAFGLLARLAGRRPHVRTRGAYDRH